MLSFTLNGREYPRLILGGDAFLNYWGPQANPRLATVQGVYGIMHQSKELGVGGVDLSMNSHVIKAFRQLKSESDNSFCGFANPNWKLRMTCRDELLWDIRGKVDATFLSRLGENAEVLKTNTGAWNDWFKHSENHAPMTEEEVKMWQLDEKDLIRRLKPYKGVATYCLVGGNYGDWCIMMDRIDLLQRKIEIVGNEGFTPISITHFPSVSLSTLDKLKVEAHWVLASRDRLLLFEDQFYASLRRTRKPITLFRVLGFGRHAQHLDQALAFVKQKIKPESIVIGVNSVEEAEQSFTRAREIFLES